MSSLITLSQLETRIKNALSASAPATHWAAASIDEAITLALGDYSKAKPYVGAWTFVPSAREFNLVIGGLPVLSVARIWYPYTASNPEYPPAWIDFDFWLDAVAAPWVRLHTDAVPDGVKVARVWTRTVHSVNGLAGAFESSFVVGDEGILVVGACGYACLARSTELDETLQNMAVSTPNYGALSQLFFDRFHAMLNASRGVVL
jgi:hypothetical protein